MKKYSHYFLIVFVLASMLLGACAGAAPSVAGGGKVEASSVAYTGTIESINGTQWVVNGQAITVDPSLVSNGTFNVGDVVKVEVKVAQDGTLTVTSIEIPSQTDLSDLPGLGDDNSNDANSNDANGNDVNGNDVNGNDDNSNNANGNDGNSNGSNGNDDNSNNDNSDDGSEVFGVVDAITETSITIGGQTYDFLTNAEVKDLVQAGDFVKIHLVQNADGTFSVRELELSDPTQAGNDNSNDDNGNNGNSNDDDDDDDDENENDDDDNGNSNANDNGNGNGNGNGGNGNG